MSTTNLTEEEKTLNWDAAIEDAEAEIMKAKLRIRELTRSLRTFREHKAAGVRFPEKRQPEGLRETATGKEGL